jgi:hypothetical protein
MRRGQEPPVGGGPYDAAEPETIESRWVRPYVAQARRSGVPDRESSEWAQLAVWADLVPGTAHDATRPDPPLLGRPPDQPSAPARAESAKPAWSGRAVSATTEMPYVADPAPRSPRRWPIVALIAVGGAALIAFLVGGRASMPTDANPGPPAAGPPVFDTASTPSQSTSAPSSTAPATTTSVSHPSTGATAAQPTRSRAPGSTTPPAAAAPTAASVEARSGAVVGIAGMCLDVNGGVPADGNHVQLWGCNGTPAQTWTGGTDGTLRVVGSCLRISDNATTSGSMVEIWTCDGSSSQQWRFTNGTLVNPSTGLCLTSPSDSTAQGTHLTVAVCAAKPGQRWTAPPPV